MGLRVEFLNEANLERILDLVNTVFRPETRTMYQEGPLVWLSDFFGYSVAYFDGDRPVSFVGAVPAWISLWETQIPVILVGDVCTLPEYRGRGLASDLLNEALSRAYADGYSIVYISGDHGLYRAAGGVDFLYATIEFKANEDLVRKVASVVKKTSSYSVRFYFKEDYEKLFSIYMSQGIKFVRLKKHFEHLYNLYGLRDKSEFGTESIMGFSYPVMFVVEKAGTPVAYVTIGFSGGSELLTGLSLEFAGDLYAVVDGFLMSIPTYVDLFKARGYSFDENFTVSFYATAGGYDSDIMARRLKEVVSEGVPVHPVRKVGHKFYVIIVNEDTLPLYTSSEIFLRRVLGEDAESGSVAKAIKKGRIRLPDYGFNFV